VADEFGPARGRVLTQDLVLGDLDGRTAAEALDAGVPAREVWLALCRGAGVPESRRYGVGLPDPH
jgi:hypothetical protein